jgi:Ca2+:H+ antiporter
VTETAPVTGPNWADRVFLGLLVVFLPLAIVSHFVFHGTVTFVVCALALIPLARQMGTATEVIAEHSGAAVGGLMNATFGNAAELILSLVALRAGELEVVKASITGSILGNILLVTGASVLAGGLKRSVQKFNVAGALSGASMMFLALTALVVPDLFHIARGPAGVPLLWPLSIATALVLLVIYGLSLLFSLKTHAHLYESEAGGDIPDWSMRRALTVLLLSTVGVALVAELLVDALEEAIHGFGLTRTFVGVVIIAVVGNAAEHSTAVITALKDKLDVSFNIAFESSKQIALFVAPVLVLLSGLFGHPMTLEFSHMEVLGIALAVGGVTLIVLDGESNWLEGVMLIGIYAILAVAFFFIP